MLGLLIDLVAAVLLVRFTRPGTTRMMLGLLAGWVAALAASGVVGIAFGWTPFDMLSSLTTGLLVHPLIVGGLIWLIGRLKLRLVDRRKAT
jgi:Na+/citrate or Na+/malate symporter